LFHFVLQVICPSFQVCGYDEINHSITISAHKQRQMIQEACVEILNAYVGLKMT
jgi:hypothetical protein